MTSMVDVTFLLLIFFMVTASFSIQSSMDFDGQRREEARTQPNESWDYVTVFISPQNEFRIRTTEKDWHDSPNRHELRIQLAEALLASSRPEELLILAHQDCYHDKVIQAMDTGIELNFRIQVLMTDEEF